MRTLLRGLVAFAFAFAMQITQAGTLPGPVVDTKWLASHLNQVQVVDVRSNLKRFTTEPKFELDPLTGKKKLAEVGGHIAGAHLIDFNTMRADRMFGALKVSYMIPEKANFERLVRAAGVDAGKPIVLVPVGAELSSIDEALRVYWQFKVYGEDDIAVLDGGTVKWLIDRQPYSVASPAPHRGNWTARSDRSAQYIADSDDVAQAVATHGATLVDARDARQFLGLAKRDYVYAYGHIEGAKLYSTSLMFKKSRGALVFMSPATYRGLMQAEGIDPAGPAITYCNSGHLAAGPWFILSELLGDKQARLYDGSLHRWTLEKRPLVGAVPLN